MALRPKSRILLECSWSWDPTWSLCPSGKHPLCLIFEHPSLTSVTVLTSSQKSGHSDFLHPVTTYNASQSVTGFWLVFFWLRARFSLLVADITNWHTGITLHKQTSIIKSYQKYLRRLKLLHWREKVITVSLIFCVLNIEEFALITVPAICLVEKAFACFFWHCNLWVFLTYPHFLLGLFLCSSYGIRKQRELPKKSHEYGWQEWSLSANV